METKKQTIQLDIPEYLTIDQYSRMNLDGELNKVEKMASILSAFTGYELEEVKRWTMKSMSKVFEAYSSLADTKNEFHSLIEWNGQLLGYSHINAMTLGCYIDLEYLSKDVAGNLHKIAALLYRPVTDHRFDSISFTIKQKLKMVNNKVENVFDWYTVEEYDSNKRKKVEESFRSFPAHIILGALAFFLTTANLYLTTTASSDNQIKKLVMKRKRQELLESLSRHIGAGGGLSTTSLNPTYLALQGINQ